MADAAFGEKVAKGVVIVIGGRFLVWVDDVRFVENALAKGPAPKGIEDIVDRAALFWVPHLGMSFAGPAPTHHQAGAGSSTNTDRAPPRR